MAAIIHSIGADRKALNNAVCFELADAGRQRSINIEKNEQLIARSKGLLACLSGEERFLSVGCGHTAAFVKLAKAGGKTTAPSLQDADGNIDVGRLCKNAEMKAMLTEGWTWTVIEASVDIEYPQFANIAQKALNKNKHVAQNTAELEMAL